jgi:hypothetical protein
VLVAGGDNGSNSIDSAELYDLAAGSWTRTGSMATAREFHTATLLPNGKVLVAGGSDGFNTASNSVELYDPANGIWTATGNGSLIQRTCCPQASYWWRGDVVPT